MALLKTPTSIEDAPEKSQSILKGIESRMGSAPNGFRTMSIAPAVLEGFLGINGALGKGDLDAATRERIAITVAEVNSCNYCLAAHSYFGQNFNNLTEKEVNLNRQGRSLDEKANAAVKLAKSIAENRGTIDKALFQDAKTAGYTDAQIVEIIALVGVSTLTNYINHGLEVDIDFPLLEILKAA